MKDLQLFDGRIPQMIQEEGKRQVKKWGAQRRSPFEWMSYLTEEVGELSRAIQEYEYWEAPHPSPVGPVVNEAIQVATLAAKIAEMYLNLDAALDK